MKCSEENCHEDAEYAYTWPACDRKYVCVICLEIVKRAAKMAGIFLPFFRLSNPATHNGSSKRPVEQ